jgi:hypothetical protein
MVSLRITAVEGNVFTATVAFTPSLQLNVSHIVQVLLIHIAFSYGLSSSFLCRVRRVLALSQFHLHLHHHRNMARMPVTRSAAGVPSNLIAYLQMSQGLASP